MGSRPQIINAAIGARADIYLIHLLSGNLINGTYIIHPVRAGNYRFYIRHIYLQYPGIFGPGIRENLLVFITPSLFFQIFNGYGNVYT